jgi:SepF-like predicted cell division protein (DUF552 family)
MAFKKLKRLFSKQSDENEADYVEIDIEPKEKKSKIVVRSFVLKTFEDTTDILNVIREGYTIAVIDIKQIKSKDIVELKRSISKIKKTVDALGGSVAGFGDSTIIVTPQFAEIYKGSSKHSKAQSSGGMDTL